MKVDAVKVEASDLAAQETGDESISELVERQLQDRRMLDAEARELERKFIRQQMERERKYKDGVLLQIHRAKKAMAKRETAFENFYVAPEGCRGELFGEISNQCVQRKMDARKVFMREYDRALRAQDNQSSTQLAAEADPAEE